MYNLYGIRINNNNWINGNKEIDMDGNYFVIDHIKYVGTPLQAQWFQITKSWRKYEGIEPSV